MKRAELLFLNGAAMKELGAEDIRAGMEDVKKSIRFIITKTKKAKRKIN